MILIRWPLNTPAWKVKFNYKRLDNEDILTCIRPRSVLSKALQDFHTCSSHNLCNHFCSDYLNNRKPYHSWFLKSCRISWGTEKFSLNFCNHFSSDYLKNRKTLSLADFWVLQTFFRNWLVSLRLVSNQCWIPDTKVTSINSFTH